MTSDLHAQKIIGPEAAGAVGISDQIFHVVGDQATVITRPVDLNAGLLTLLVAKGNFRVRLGDLANEDFYDGLYPTETDLTTGNGAILMRAGQDLVLPAPNKVTVLGDAADAVLTFFWL